MNASRLLLALALSIAGSQTKMAAGASKDLLDINGPTQPGIAPDWGSAEQVTTAFSRDSAAPGLTITIRPGNAGYPGVNLKPPGKAWDLSAFGHVEARVVNTGAKAALFALRVDNPGGWQAAPWNTEQIHLKPGERGTVTVIFGHQYGHKRGYALNPKEVVNILLFSDKTDSAKSFRVESLTASGPPSEEPPVDPATTRIKPKDGFLFGGQVRIDAARQVEVKDALAYTNGGLSAQRLGIRFPAKNDTQPVTFMPAKGRWDLTLATEVRIRLRNIGETPIVPTVQVISNGGPTDAIAATAINPGNEREVVVPFIPAVPGRGVPVAKSGYFGNERQTGTTFGSDAVGAVRIGVKHEGAANLEIESIAAAAPPATVPDWLGKRPPPASGYPEGDWTKTFDEDFDGPAIDQSKWNIYGPNYWDRASHWSRENLLLGGGMATLHFEKKRGYHNDNPNSKAQNLTGSNQSDYACGYLDTYGKWRQRYGYFEARVKLPRAPGLWPTFWMMPDRGPAAANRTDTGSGAMEFDIMEHLTRWGPYRYNVALHFDGYGREHKSVGSQCNYVQADKDGFITAGMLWLPGKVAFYGNGKEMWSWESPRVSNVPSYFIIEMTTGGWDNNAVDDRQLPADYSIDYVRAWQRKDLGATDGNRGGAD